MNTKISVRVWAVCLLFIAQLFVVQNAISSPNQRSALGMNTNEMMDANASMPFVDLFKMSLPFEEARPWLTKGKVAYDKNGWPMRLNGGVAGTRFIGGLPANTIPNGIYTVLYDGQGEMQYNVDAKLVKRLPGKDLIAIRPGKNRLISASLIIKKTNPKNHIRNIRILPPGGICMGNAFRRVNSAKQCGGRRYLSFEKHHKQIIFNPDYLAFMKDFKVIRFMNMSGITRNDLSSWNKRPMVADSTWGGSEGRRGVPIEIMVKLANQLNADPWFNLPHKADNAFIQRYAHYVKANLKPGLKVYVEYTNEAWNGIFTQSEYMRIMGTRQRLDKDRNIAGYKFYAKQSTHIFRAWERIFGGTQRIVRVVGSLTTDQRISKIILGYQDTYKYTDALAIGAYLQIPQKEIHSIRSVGKIFQILKSPKNRYSLSNTMDFIKKQADVAKNFGVDLIAYEGGQHLVDYKTKSLKDGPNPFLIQANKDPRMATLYYELLQGWKKAGGKLFIAFSAPRQYTWHGSWGIKEHIAQSVKAAPKYRALLAFNKNTPCWWNGCTSRSIVRHNKAANVSAVSLASNKTTPVKLSKPNATYSRKMSSSRNVWQHTSVHPLRNIINGKITGGRDLSGSWSSYWDDRNLYVKVAISDDKHIRDSRQAWGDDSIEIYIDADRSKHAKYDRKNDFQLTYRLHDRQVSVGQFSPRRGINNIRQKMVKTRNGYTLETAIPWATLNTRPRAGMRIGFDVQINDDDTGRERDGKMAWSAKHDSSWKNPQMFGELLLAPSSGQHNSVASTNR